MPWTRFSTEPIINQLRQIEISIFQGRIVSEVAKDL